MIEFSKKRQGRAKDENLDIRQLAVAELMAWGWDAVDAMLAVGLVKESDRRVDAQYAAIRYTSGENFVKVHKKRVAQLKGGSVLDEYGKIHPTPGSNRAKMGRPRADGGTRREWQGAAPEPVEDAEILAAIWETIGKLDAGDPKRVDLLDKYDKLKRRQNNGEDDTTIHFYLPRPECDTCPFRGNQIITEPEVAEKPKDKEEPVEEEPEWMENGEPKPGYTVNGKKIGRPKKKSKAGRPKKVRVEEFPEDEPEETTVQPAVQPADPNEPIVLDFEEEL